MDALTTTCFACGTQQPCSLAGDGHPICIDYMVCLSRVEGKRANLPPVDGMVSISATRLHELLTIERRYKGGRKAVRRFVASPDPREAEWNALYEFADKGEVTT